MTWRDLRCQLPAGGYKPGLCEGLLFRVRENGDLEMKCHRCHRIEVVSRETLDQYRQLEYATT